MSCSVCGADPAVADLGEDLLLCIGCIETEIAMHPDAIERRARQLDHDSEERAAMFQVASWLRCVHGEAKPR